MTTYESHSRMKFLILRDEARETASLAARPSPVFGRHCWLIWEILFDNMTLMVLADSRFC